MNPMISQKPATPTRNPKLPSWLALLIAVIGMVSTEAQSDSVDFTEDVQPIFERLSDAERETLVEWVKQGGRLPESWSAIPDTKEHLEGEALFEFEIAPLLAKHCLECHDTNRKEGALDLSRKAAAFRGGDSGKAIDPGHGSESELWELVESDDMPEDRPPLSRREKDLLKRWIDEGAVWTVDWIDPATYENEGGGEQWVRRLTISEYIETVRSTVGVDISEQAYEILPPDLRADGFSNTAYNLNVDMGHVNAYSQLAGIIVERMDTEAFALRFHDNPKFTDKDMGKLIEGIGRRLLRGPLTEEEVILFRGISTTVASAGGKMDEAVGYLVEAMLQSPRFIYRIEKQGINGESVPIDGYELASRLSYGIWGGPPDDRLLDLAEEDKLLDRENLETQIARLLSDPRAKNRSIEFAYEWLDLGRLDSLRPSSEKFPEWDPNLAGDMRAETLTVFEKLVWEDKRPLTDLLNVQNTFVTPELAEHYGLKKNRKAIEAGELIPYDLSTNPARGGLLTHGSVLTMGGDDASMVTRGLFVLRDLLRGIVKDPPPCLDTSPIPSSPGQSQRVIAEERVANRSCGGCHEKFEPLAFGLERFDGLGSYYKRDVFGNKLRQDGEILFPGAAKSQSFKTSAELMDLLASSDRVAETITWKLVQFVMGRPLGARDASEVQKIHENAREGGGTYQSIISSIAKSDLIRKKS